MIKKYYLIILSLIFTISLQGQVKWINPLPQGNILNSVYFPDTNTGFAAGDAGTIMRSTDGGSNWTLLESGTALNLNSIYFLDENLGLAVGDSGVVLSTADNGDSWQMHNSGTEKILRGVVMIDSMHAVACGPPGIMLHSEDAGLHWETVNVSVNTVFWSLSFPSANIGYAAGGGGPAGGNGSVIITPDGGLSWVLLNDTIQESLYSICFTDNYTGYAAGNNSTIIKTSDGGLNWDYLENPGLYHIYSMVFTDALHGFTTDVDGIILKTDDGGQSWTSLDPGVENPLLGLARIDDQSFCTVGVGGLMLISNDNGNSINRIGEGPVASMVSIAHPDAEHFLVIGDETLIRSDNSGETWTKKDIPDLQGSISTSFVNANTGYALTYMGIYKTTDSGDSWTKVSGAPRADWMNSIDMVTENLGFAVGGGQSPGGITWGTILKTTDGNSWSSVPSPTSSALTKTYFINPTEGFLLGISGKLFKTEDAGNNWTPIPLPVNYDLRDMVFAASKTAYLLASSYWSGNAVLKSTDAGMNWSIIYEDDVSYNQDAFRAFSFSDSLNGYVVGTNGLVMSTRDGGNTWLKNKRFSSNYLSDIVLVNDSAGYIAGIYGTLVSFGDISQGLPEYTTENPAIIKVYPNPYSENLNIQIYSNYKDGVQVSMFDQSGRMIIYQKTTIYKGWQDIKLDLPDNLPEGEYILSIKGSKTKASTKVIKS